MKEYNYTLSILRLLALILVVSLHVMQKVHISPDGFPCMCGVPLFFIISAYIFGCQSKIDNTWAWLRKRFIRVWIPFALFLIVDIALSYWNGARLDALDFFKSFLILPSAPLDTLRIGHCWFVSYILLFYILIPLMHKMLDKNFILGGSILIVGSAVFAQLTAYIPVYGKISAPHIVLYVIAFITGQLQLLKGQNNAMLSALGVGAVVGGVSYYLSHHLSNVTISSFADLCYANFFSLGLFALVMLVSKHISYSNIISKPIDTAIKWLDRYSFYFFLTHNLFVWGWLGLFNNGLSVSDIVLYILLIIISGLTLGRLSEYTIKFISK